MSTRASHRVVSCNEDGSTSLVSRQMRSLAPGEMLLRLRCVGLCGTDLFKLATRSEPPGTVLGHELVGVELPNDGVVARRGEQDLLSGGRVEQGIA